MSTTEKPDGSEDPKVASNEQGAESGAEGGRSGGLLSTIFPADARVWAEHGQGSAALARPNHGDLNMRKYFRAVGHGLTEIGTLFDRFRQAPKDRREFGRPGSATQEPQAPQQRDARVQKVRELFVRLPQRPQADAL